MHEACHWQAVTPHLRPRLRPLWAHQRRAETEDPPQAGEPPWIWTRDTEGLWRWARGTGSLAEKDGSGHSHFLGGWQAGLVQCADLSPPSKPL